MTRVALTLASGQLGSKGTRATIKVVGKEYVIGLARTPSKAESLGVEVRPGDYSQTQSTALQKKLCLARSLKLTNDRVDDLVKCAGRA